MGQPPPAPARTPPKLCLLGGFNLIVQDQPVDLPIHAQRVLAYLSLLQPAQRAHLRTGLADRLWGSVSDKRAQASLRTALWRIRRADPRLVRASRETVLLDESVDVRRCVAQASRLLASNGELDPRDTELSALRGDLLPGWDEDWLLLERERIRQVQIHALEALAHRLLRLGRHLEAIEAALAAIAEEPPPRARAHPGGTPRPEQPGPGQRRGHVPATRWRTRRDLVHQRSGKWHYHRLACQIEDFAPGRVNGSPGRGRRPVHQVL